MKGMICIYQKKELKYVDNINGKKWKTVVVIIPLFKNSRRILDGYYVSTKGRIASDKLTKGKRKYLLSTCITNRGRERVKIGYANYFIHRLAGVTFIPNRHKKKELHHIDGNPLNNNVNNLIWVTAKEHGLFHKKNRTISEQAIIDKLLSERRKLVL